jgi:hypothetical protein
MPTTPGMPRWHCGGVGFALAIGAGTGRPHGGQHRHRGALACESNSDHGRASFIADGCVGAAPRQSVHIISALAGTLVGQHFLLRFPRTQRPRPRLRPQPPKPPPGLLALSKATKKDTRAQFAKDTPVLSRDIFSPCSKAIPSRSQPPLPSRPEYGCLSNTMP